jgi:hypothetical protein
MNGMTLVVYKRDPIRVRDLAQALVNAQQRQRARQRQVAEMRAFVAGLPPAVPFSPYGVPR